MKKDIFHPPRLAEWILLRIAFRGEEFAAEEDFKEEFQCLFIKKGPTRAKLWYWFQVLISFPGFIKSSV